VLVGRPEVDSPAGTLRSLQSVPSDSDDDELGEEKVDGSTSDNGDYDADVDDELNASSRLMLSRIIAAKLRAALPVSTVREHSRIDEHDQDDDDDENATVRPRTTRERVVSCCRSFVSFLASTVGLTCLLVVYILLGGALFVGLEAQYERVVQTDVMATRDEYVRQLWNITERMNVLHPRNWSAVAEQLLERYAHEVYVATKKRGWDGRQENEDSDQQWNFASSLLYAITVVTTIGTPVIIIIIIIIIITIITITTTTTTTTTT